jgi:hypothetical protein
VRNILSHIFGEAHADGESDKLIASVMKQAASQHREWSQPKAQDIPAADLRKMLSQCQWPDKPSVMINGVEYVVKLNDVMYQVSNHKQTTLPLALIDRGANGGVTGSDTRLIDKSLHSVQIQGIDDHMIKDVPIGTVGAVVNMCMMSMGSSVDVFLSTNTNGRFITSMHLTRSRVLITTNFTTPWSNLRMTQISSLTLLSTVLIVLITFATMRQ